MLDNAFGRIRGVYQLVAAAVLCAVLVVAVFLLGYLNFQNETLYQENSMIATYNQCMQLKSTAISTITAQAQVNNQYQSSLKGYLEVIFTPSSSADEANANFMLISASVLSGHNAETSVALMDTILYQLKGVNDCLMTLADKQQNYATLIGYMMLSEGYTNNKPFPVNIYAEWSNVPRKFNSGILPGVKSKDNKNYVTVLDITPRLVLAQIVEQFESGRDSLIVLPTPGK